MILAHVVHRIAVDPTFAAHLQHTPQETLAAEGLSLTEEELTAVLTTVQGTPHWQESCRAPRFVLEGSANWWPADIGTRSILCNRT